MFEFYRLKHRAAFREIEERKKLSIFDYQRLSADLVYAPEERVIDNNMYGYAHYLKEYSGINQDLKAYMEHGLFLGGIVHKDQHHWHFKRVITMSKKRQHILAQKLPQKESIAIGPYIHYAHTLLNEQELAKLKKELGKVLLVFPFHSMKSVKANFDQNRFLEEIEKRAQDFDSVLICMYYLDARNKEHIAQYEQRGYRVVTAGHKFDHHFVARQRTHIELADMTMSNGMGTQTGFCVYLEKPHYIFKQEVSQQAASNKELERFKLSSGMNEKEQVAYERNLFAQLFSEYSTEISPKQLEITAEYWGFTDVKTREEIRSVFG